jgi:hypothetical protein
MTDWEKAYWEKVCESGSAADICRAYDELMAAAPNSYVGRGVPSMESPSTTVVVPTIQNTDDILLAYGEDPEVFELLDAYGEAQKALVNADTQEEENFFWELLHELRELLSDILYAFGADLRYWLQPVEKEIIA